MTSDHQERARVRSRIGEVILSFCMRQIGPFHMGQLLRYVEGHMDGRVAPGSPERILRLLRKELLLDYEVVSRRDSLYRIRWVRERPVRHGGQAELFYERAS